MNSQPKPLSEKDLIALQAGELTDEQKKRLAEKQFEASNK